MENKNGRYRGRLQTSQTKAFLIQHNKEAKSGFEKDQMQRVLGITPYKSS